MSEHKYFLFLIIALFFFFLHRVTTKTHGVEIQYHDGIGTIERIVEDDAGYPWYYVKIQINGSALTAKTDTYRSVPDDVAVGDSVHVRYHYTKNGKIRSIITEPGFERIIREDVVSKPVMLYISMASFGLFLLLLVHKIMFGY